MDNLLLEIGTEEIPARFLPDAIAQLRDRSSELFNSNAIEFSDIKTYATPRRLALIVKGISPFQKDMVKEITGPPARVAFDPDGNPTKAATGFANSQGIDVSELKIKKTEKGEYLVAEIRQKGGETKTLLPDLLKRLIMSLHFPKSMRWGSGNLKFVRPIHWILALYSNEIVPFEIDGIRSGNITRGHRFLSPASFVIREINSYINLLENNYVIIDQDERRRLIWEGLLRLANSVDGKIIEDEELIETVTHLVEYPMPVLCQFQDEYLRLPKELLITVMKGHQKYFAIEDSDGQLKNHFIVISNTKEVNSDIVKKGAERVIKARFEDAAFYYEEDLKRALSSRIEDLKRVTFHERLGSLFDKTNRIVRLASMLSERLFPEKKSLIERASWLSKTDLLTGVVREFPELQGLMGKYYAIKDNEDPEVAEALLEQYLPSHSGDRLPSTDTGSILSLSDKMDNIVSFFDLGLNPTGSEDPFALRRQAIGIISILLDRGYKISIEEIVNIASEGLSIESDKKISLVRDVLNFFTQRISPLLESRGIGHDVIDTIIPIAGNIPLSEMIKRIEAITAFKEAGLYKQFLLSFKRIRNIIPETELPGINQDLLIEPAEKALYSDLMNIKPLVNELMRQNKFFATLELFSTMIESINRFFDSVLVMDKREEIRLNRLSLLKEIWLLVSSLADISKLT